MTNDPGYWPPGLTIGPCPFCGSTSAADRDPPICWRSGECVIECECGARSPWRDSVQAVIAAWNGVGARAAAPSEDGKPVDPGFLYCASCDLALQRPDDPGVNYAYCRACVASLRAESNDMQERLNAQAAEDNRHTIAMNDLAVTVREALTEALAEISRGRVGHLGTHDAYCPQIAVASVERWRAALAAGGAS